MNVVGYILSAGDDGLGGLERILVIVVFLVIAAVASVAGKLREKAQRERARREEEQHERQAGAGRKRPQPRPPPRRTPAEEAAVMLRELFGERTEAPPAPPPPRSRAVRPAAPKRTRRPGDAVQGGVERSEGRLSIEEPQRRQRLADVERLRAGIRGEAGLEARRIGFQVDLSGRRAARRAIVYMEIIGPPKALRDYPERWEL